MAIDTNNEKFSLLVFGRTTDPANIPVSPGSIDQFSRQQLLWSYVGILFNTIATAFNNEDWYEPLHRWHRR